MTNDSQMLKELKNVLQKKKKNGLMHFTLQKHFGWLWIKVHFWRTIVKEALKSFLHNCLFLFLEEKN